MGGLLVCVYALSLGALALGPLMLGRHTVLIQDMLLAYYCYFDDFHRQWSLTHWPLWSSSYQTGMPMFAYWQSGWLYPVTWLCFGPLPTQCGLYLFYVLHFALAGLGFSVLGPRLRLPRFASLWAGTVFALSGTLLARYEHPTFLAGWAYMPLVLGLFLRAMRKSGGQRAPAYALYAWVFLLQALGGHPQATITTAVLLLPFTLWPTGGPWRAWPGLAMRRWRQALCAHLMAGVLCLPLFLPFYGLMQATSRYGGSSWEAAHASPVASTLPLPPDTGMAKARPDSASAATPFAYREFTAGALRPVHALALLYPYALGSPAHASWWGHEPWTEVYLGLGGLAVLMLIFVSWRRAAPDLRLLAVTGAVGLWLALGPWLGASQLTFHLPLFDALRRPARWDILAVLALAAWSGLGLRLLLKTGVSFVRPRRSSPRLWLGLALLHGAGAAGFWGLGHAEGPWRRLSAAWAGPGGKDYAPKLMTLSRDLAQDFTLTALACASVFLVLRSLVKYRDMPVSSPRRVMGVALIALLVIGQVRLHWVHFHRFPPDYYEKPPATLASLDLATRPYWRVNHYLEYPGDSLWRMHHAPLRSLDLYEREKQALSYGIHAVYGLRHVGAHLPLLWPMPSTQRPGRLSGRYLLSDLQMSEYRGEALKPLGRHAGVTVYEVADYLPRLQHVPTSAREAIAGNPGKCPDGFARNGNLCALETRDGDLTVRGVAPPGRARLFRAGDILVFREHAFSGWEARLDGGAWRPLQRDALGFQFVSIDSDAEIIAIRYFPRTWFWLLAWSATCFVLLAVACHFYTRKRILTPHAAN